jgi:hypothetical protein
MQTIQSSHLALCQLSSEECAEDIVGQHTSFSETVERICTEQVSGGISLNEACELMCNVVQRLQPRGWFPTDPDAALELKSAITKLCHAVAKAGQICFPSGLPPGARPGQYFTVSDAAARLGLVVEPRLESLGHITAARGLVANLSQIYPGWWVVGILWGEGEDPVWFDRLDFASLKLCEAFTRP